MIIFQVMIDTDIVSKLIYDERRPDIHDSEDAGLFSSFDLAVQFIEKDIENKVNAAIEDGNEAWIGAWPSDTEDGKCDVYFIKRIKIYDRKEADECDYSYVVRKREVV